MAREGRLSSAVEKQLECPVCLLRFRTPKLLECMHTFCQECLIHLSQRSKLGGIYIRCPTCRQKTKVPDVTNLHNNFIVQGIIDSMELALKKGGNNEVADHNKLSDSNKVADSDKVAGIIKVVDTSTSSNDVLVIGISGISLEEGEVPNFTSLIPNSLTPDTDRLGDHFNFVPSFNFGELDKTSFATPRVTCSGRYDFSAFNSAPTYSWGSLNKTSFCGSNVGSASDTNIYFNCNRQLFSKDASSNV